MSNKNQIKYREIFNSLIWELLNNDCNPYYRWIWNNNMYFLIQDFLDYLNLEKSLIRDNQINLLLDEFLYLIDSDIVFNSNFRKKANELIFDIKSYKDNKDINKLKNNLEIIFKHFNNNNSYIRALVWILNSYLLKEKYDLENDIDFSKNIKKFKKLVFTFINLLNNKVWISRKYLEFIRIKFLDNVNPSDDIIFERGFSELCKLFFCDSKDFKIFFKVKIWDIQANKNKISKINIEYFFNNISNENIYYINDLKPYIWLREVKEDFQELKNDFLRSDDNIFYIWVNITWKDIYTICRIAKENLNKIFDTFLYEFNALKLNILNISMVIDDERIFLINDSYNEFLNRKQGNENNIISLNKILNNVNIKINTQVKISNSIKYYKLFLVSENSEVKLLNLWIALESLFSDITNSESSFEKLKRFIPKFISMNLMKNYFDEFQNFILHRIDMENENNSRYKNHSKIKDIIQSINKVKNWRTWYVEWKFNNVGSFKVFSDSKYFDQVKELLRNEYFIQKYQRLSDIIKKNEKWEYTELLTFLKRYESKIKWVLNKIYRYRNYIVHWGKKVNTDSVINDLEFIYLELVDDILKKIWTDYFLIDSIEEYFSRINRSYNKYEKWINNRLKDHNIQEKNIVLPFIIF